MENELRLSLLVWTAAHISYVKANETVKNAFSFSTDYKCRIEQIQQMISALFKLRQCATVQCA